MYRLSCRMPYNSNLSYLHVLCALYVRYGLTLEISWGRLPGRPAPGSPLFELCTLLTAAPSFRAGGSPSCVIARARQEMLTTDSVASRLHRLS